MNSKETAARLGCSNPALVELRVAKLGPSWRRLPNGRPDYDPASVEAYAAARAQGMTHKQATAHVQGCPEPTTVRRIWPRELADEYRPRVLAQAKDWCREFPDDGRASGLSEAAWALVLAAAHDDRGLASTLAIVAHDLGGMGHSEGLWIVQGGRKEKSFVPCNLSDVLAAASYVRQKGLFGTPECALQVVARYDAAPGREVA